MTVQTPQGPGAPPWAAPPPAEPPAQPPAQPFGGLVPPYGSPDNRHGQLLVRFPGEVHGSSRPEAPSWRPVVAWTFFLSALGLIPTLRRAARARRYGRRRTPYWIAFAATLVAGAAFWTVLTVDVAIPAYQDHRESLVTEALQAGLLSDGRVEKAVGVDLSRAECVPQGDRGPDGMRTYSCTVLFTEGGATAVTVTADENAAWQLVK